MPTEHGTTYRFQECTGLGHAGGREGWEAGPSHPVTLRSKQSALDLIQEIPGELPLPSTLHRGSVPGELALLWAGPLESKLWPARAGMLRSQNPAGPGRQAPACPPLGAE